MPYSQDRPKNSDALQKAASVDAAQQAIQRTGAILDAARGRSDLGSTGDVGIQTIDVWPDIDPVTGEAEEPVRPPDYFRCSTKFGEGLPLKP